MNGQEGGALLKAISHPFAFVIGIDGRIKKLDIKYLCIIDTIEKEAFVEWLGQNYTYNKPTDEWVDGYGKRYTESYLQIKYSLT